MKRTFIIAVMAMAIGLVSCGKKTEIVISDTTYTPTTVTATDDVTVTTLATCNMDEFTVNLIYTIGEGDAQTVAMTAGEANNQYVATIPAQELGTVVTFKVQGISGEETKETAEFTYTVVEAGGGDGGDETGDYANIVLNELNGGYKFIEIYNKGTEDVNLEGVYMIKDEKVDTITGEPIITWTADNTIVVPAGGFLLLYSEDVVIEGEAQEGYAENLVFASGFSSKKAVKIEIFDPSGNSIDAFVRCPEGGSWGDGLTNVNESSFARVPDGGDWMLVETATPGEANPTEGSEIPL